jgi:flagella basal body P-ring formation protein FlgA
VLGDIAEIAIADETQAKKLAAIELFPTPGPGQRRFVRLPEVREILELRSIELADCRVSGSSLIVIHGPPPAAPPPSPERAFPAEKPAGSPAPAKTEAVVLAVAAVRPVERGQVIQTADVQLVSFPGTAARDGLLHDLDLAVGQEAIRQFAPGQPLETRGLRKPLLVRRRDTVRVAVVAPGVRLAIDAVAHEDGSEGDFVLIETSHSQDKIRARVCGPKQVELRTGSEPQ